MTDQPASDIAKPLTLGMVLYPDFTLLDLVGPQAVLGLHSETLLLSKDMKPVATETGLLIHPTMTFDDCPDVLDVLFVPGGYGTNAAMQDAAIVDFLVRSGKTARYVTSVCSARCCSAWAVCSRATGRPRTGAVMEHWAHWARSRP